MAEFLFKHPFHMSGIVALWVTHLPRNTEDVGSDSCIGRNIVAQVTPEIGSPLSMGHTPSDRLKNFRDIDKWSAVYDSETG